MDVHSVLLRPLTRAEWLKQVLPLMYDGEIIALHSQESEPVPADVQPVPDLESLRRAVWIDAQAGNFDELERWAERLRKDEVVINGRFASEPFYAWLAEIYVAPSPAGTQGKLEGFFPGAIRLRRSLAESQAGLGGRPHCQSSRLQ